MINDTFKLTGAVNIVLLNNGIEIDKRVINNIVVDSGKILVANYLLGDVGDTSFTPVPPISHIALGTGSNPALPDQIILQNEIGGGRVAIATRIQDTNIATFKALFPPTIGTGFIQEAGIFNSATAGTMFARTSFAGINKSDDDILIITWSITVN